MERREARAPAKERSAEAQKAEAEPRCSADRRSIPSDHRSGANETIPAKAGKA
jgi:hypothetical protein